MGDQPLISTNEAETIVEKTTNTAEVNGKIVQKIVAGTVIGIAAILSIMVLVSLFSSGSKLHGVFFSSAETRTLQFK